MNSETKQRLQQYYRDRVPGIYNAEIGRVQEIPSGWESELYAFTLESGPPANRACDELVLRIYSGEGAWNKAAREFHSLQQLHEIGYPVPRVDMLECDHSPFGRPFMIMEKLDGEEMWSRMGTPQSGEMRDLVTLFCQLFAQLHHLDWHPFVDEAEYASLQDPYAFIDEWLRLAQEGHHQFPHSGLMPVVEWLQARREAFHCTGPSPTHNDFHPGNVLLCKNGSPVVIDLTGFGISDARFDLAWTLMLIDAYMGPEWRSRVLQEYERYAGQVEALEVFEVFACVRRLFDLSVSLRLGAEKVGMHPDAVAAMRKNKVAFERVYQLLLARTGIRVVEVEELIASLG